MHPIRQNMDRETSEQTSILIASANPPKEPAVQAAHLAAKAFEVQALQVTSFLAAIPGAILNQFTALGQSMGNAAVRPLEVVVRRAASAAAEGAMDAAKDSVAPGIQGLVFRSNTAAQEPSAGRAERAEEP